MVLDQPIPRQQWKNSDVLLNDKLAVLGAAFAAIVSSSNAQQEPMGGHELGMMGKSQRLVQSGNLDQNERSLESAQYRLKQQNKLKLPAWRNA